MWGPHSGAMRVIESIVGGTKEDRRKRRSRVIVQGGMQLGICLAGSIFTGGGCGAAQVDIILIGGEN